MFFSNSNPKIPKSGVFDSKFEDFYFCTKLCSLTNSNTQIISILVPNLYFWFYINLFHFDKFESAYLKCDNSFLQNLA